jgi:plasmid segregation protein ParM
MILGYDGGSSMSKNSKGIIIESKVSKVESLNSSDSLILDGTKYFLGEGEYDTNYRKIEKLNYLPLLFGSLALTTKDTFNQIAVGLPISQYKEDKESLKNLILTNREKWLTINGEDKHLIIEDVAVFPEGALTVSDTFEGIVVDIGGRTTDICSIEFRNNKRKILNLLSYPRGTQNLYSDFIKSLNNKEGLDLKDTDIERILKNGLKIYGQPIEINFALEVFKEFIDDLISKLQIEYSLKTYDVSLVGGGAELLYKSIKKRVPNCNLIENSLFANAIAYEELDM